MINGSLESKLPFIECEVQTCDFANKTDKLIYSALIKVTNVICYIQPIVVINLITIGCKLFSLFR